MKKTLIIFLLFTGITNAQIIDFKDAPFKNALLRSTVTDPIATDITGVGIVVDSNNDREIDISEASKVYGLDIRGQNINNLEDLDKFTNLLKLECARNFIKTINLSNQYLTTLNCDNSPSLEKLFLKNGRNDIINNFSFKNNPRLTFVCVDELEKEDVQALIVNYGYTNCVVNSYCSFTPGGKYNTLTGSIRFDVNNDGCDPNDDTFKNLKLNTTQFAENGDQIKETIFVNNNGNYVSNQENPKLAISPSFENPTYFTSTPSKENSDFSTIAVQKLDFCIAAQNIFNDLEVAITPLIDARPGFEAKYQLVFKNKGNQPVSGNLVMSFNDTKMTYIAAIPNVDNQNANLLTWNYTNLLPFETRTIDVTFNINASTNVGDLLKFTAEINPTSSDNLVNDNYFTYTPKALDKLVQNSITCLQGETMGNANDYLHYKINFENIIEEDIKNVVIENEIDPNTFDVETIQILKSSNDVEVSLKKNILKFVYQGITLRRAAAGNPKTGGGTGGVLMKIIPKNTIISGNTLSNNANVFFDYNAPIGTNTASTLYLNLTLNIEDIKTDSSINIYPNPAKNFVNINANSIIQSIQLYDAQGRLLQIKYQDKNQTNLDISARAKGIYFLKITTDNGIKIEKLIKE
jgi:hypothetical protein